MTPLAISVRQATELAPIGVTSIYKAISQGRLRVTKVYGRTMIDYASFCLLVGGGNPNQDGHNQNAVNSYKGVLSEKLNPTMILDNQEESLPTTLHTAQNVDTGEGQRRTAKRKRPRIKGNKQRSEQLRRFAKGI